MNKDAPFTIQLDHINAICQAALACETPDPKERHLQRRFHRPVAVIHEYGKSDEPAESQGTSKFQFSR